MLHCCAGGRIGTGFFESSFFEKIWGRCARTGRGGKDDAANEDVTHGCLCVKIIWATKAQAPAAWVGNTAGERERLCFPAAGGGGDARWQGDTPPGHGLAMSGGKATEQPGTLGDSVADPGMRNLLEHG